MPVIDPHVHLELDHPAESLAALDAYSFEDAEQQRITYDNAVELFGLRDLVGD